MKVLLDHNLPHKLRRELAAASDHEFVTTSFLGWGGLRNGELLRAAEEATFDVFVTGDRTMVYEQNLTARRVAMVALSTNNWPIIKNFVPQILTAIHDATPGEFAAVDCGTFSRKSTRETLD